jgi:hypothetical protein
MQESFMFRGAGIEPAMIFDIVLDALSYQKQHLRSSQVGTPHGRVQPIRILHRCAKVLPIRQALLNLCKFLLQEHIPEAFYRADFKRSLRRRMV